MVARDAETGETSYKAVEKTSVRQAEQVVTVALAEVQSGAVVESITCTPEHPFFVEGQGFVNAGRLVGRMKMLFSVILCQLLLCGRPCARSLTPQSTVRKTVKLHCSSDLGQVKSGTSNGLEVLATSGCDVLSARSGRHDFGTVNVLDRPQIEQVFRLRNNGAQPVTLLPIEPACGCLTASVDLPHSVTHNSRSESFTGKLLAIIASGQEFRIRVVMNLRGLVPGSHSKSVSIYVKGSDAPVATLEMTGTLLPSLAFSTTTLDFGQVRTGEKQTKHVMVVLDQRLLHNRQPPALKTSNPAFDLKPITLDAAAEAKFQKQLLLPKQIYATMYHADYAVTLAKNAPMGPLSGELSFYPAPPQTSSQATTPEAYLLQSTNVMLSGQVIGDVTAEPSILNMGVLPTDQEVKRQIVLTVKKVALLKAMHIECRNPWITANMESPSASATQSHNANTSVVKITVDARTPAGVLDTQLTIHFADRSRLLVPVRAFLEAGRK